MKQGDVFDPAKALPDAFALRLTTLQRAWRAVHSSMAVSHNGLSSAPHAGNVHGAAFGHELLRVEALVAATVISVGRRPESSAPHLDSSTNKHLQEIS